MNKTIKTKLIFSIVALLSIAIISLLVITSVFIDRTSISLTEYIEPRTKASSLMPMKILADAEKARNEVFFSQMVNETKRFAKDIAFLRTQFRSLFLPTEDVRHILNMYVKGALESNQSALGVYAVFLPNDLDGADKKNEGASDIASNEKGRFAIYWAFNEQGEAVEEIMPEDMINDISPNSTGQAYNSWFTCPIKQAKACLLEPYIDKVDNKDVLMTSIAMPIKFKDKIVGVVGLDIALADIQTKAEEFSIKIAANDSRVLIISEDKAVVADSKAAASQGLLFHDVIGDNQLTEGLNEHEKNYSLVKNIDLGGLATWSIYTEISKKVISDQVNQTIDVLDKGAKEQLMSIAIISIILLAIGAVVVFIMADKLTAPLRTLASALKQIASGDADLTQRMSVVSQDETGQLAEHFNKFTKQLADIIGLFSKGVKTTFLAAEDAKELSITTNDKVADQQTMIAMVATAAEEMSQTSTDVAQNAVLTADAGTKVKAASSEGIVKLNNTTDTIAQLAEKMQYTNKQVDTLADNSDNIVNVLNVIKSVAEQTNLLALNAAIEAARAGEQGRGFAVVADEVRGLAARTSESVSEIETVINSLQQATKEVVSMIVDNVSMTEKCTQQAEETQVVFKTIEQSMNEMSDMSSSIASAAEQQSVVTTDVSSTLQKIQTTADELAETAKHSLYVSEQLYQSGEDQERIIARFKF